MRDPHANTVTVVRAPVRVSFGGGGTDLAAYYAQHGGFVISAAITRYSYVVVRPSADGRTTINSSDYRTWATAEHGAFLPVAEPLILPKAVIEMFGEAIAGHGVELLLASDVGPGTGLGSSSAMTVALVRALAAYTQQDLGPAEIAERACWIEIERLERPIGKQDQYASAFGGLNTITFTDEQVVVEPVGLSSATATALSQRLLLFSIGASRDSAGILHQQRLDSGSKQPVIDGLHRIKSLAHDMHQAVVHNDLDGFGVLLDRAWHEKRQLSGKVSTAAIDRSYAAAKDAGAIGGKIAGAGGGGFLLLYCPPAHQPDLRAVMMEHELQELPFDFDWDGAQVCSSG